MHYDGRLIVPKASWKDNGNFYISQQYFHLVFSDTFWNFSLRNILLFSPSISSSLPCHHIQRHFLSLHNWLNWLLVIQIRWWKQSVCVGFDPVCQKKYVFLSFFGGHLILGGKKKKNPKQSPNCRILHHVSYSYLRIYFLFLTLFLWHDTCSCQSQNYQWYGGWD